MKKFFILLLLLSISSSVSAEWHMDRPGNTHRIFTANHDHNTLSIHQKGNSIDFIITILNAKISHFDTLDSLKVVSLQIDSLEKTSIQIHKTNNSPQSTQFTLSMTNQQKLNLLNQMIGGINLFITLRENNGKTYRPAFSLIDFTAKLNDFLIAKEIGRLDYEWLLENNKEKELVCLYVATISINAMSYRLTGSSITQTLEEIPGTKFEILDNIKEDIIRDVYKIPSERLPYDPRGEKHGIFRACITS